MQRAEILERYRQLRVITSRHQQAALSCVAPQTLLEHAKQLGLAVGRTIVADGEQELTLLADLAVHTARPGRSRAIDRHARAAALPPGSDEAHALEAVRRAQFSVWSIEAHHETAGLLVHDAIAGRPAWLFDEGLAGSMRAGMTIAGRLCRAAEFAMTCGVVVPVDIAFLADVVDDAGWLQSANLMVARDDPRFATAIYRHAIAAGIMDNVEFREPALAS